MRTEHIQVIAMVVALTASVSASAEAHAQESTDQAAAVLSARASELFDAGEFERSAALLEEAIRAHDHPALHYNLARTLQELGRWEDARDEYAVFLARSPDTSERARIEARIALLDQRIARAAAVAAPPSPEPPIALPQEPPPRGIEPAPWVVSGVGVATLAVASVFAVLFDQEVGLARAAADHASAFPHTVAAEQHAITADVLFVAGGLSLAIGLIWAIVDLAEVSASPDEHAERRPGLLRF